MGRVLHILYTYEIICQWHKNAQNTGVFAVPKRSEDAFVPPIPSRLRAPVGLSSDHPITFPGARAGFRDNCHLPRVVPKHFTRIDMLFLSRTAFHSDMFHEQLPLPVPCYDLVLVTEFAVVPREAVLRAPPAPLT